MPAQARINASTNPWAYRMCEASLLPRYCPFDSHSGFRFPDRKAQVGWAGHVGAVAIPPTAPRGHLTSGHAVGPFEGRLVGAVVALLHEELHHAGESGREVGGPLQSAVWPAPSGTKRDDTKSALLSFECTRPRVAKPSNLMLGNCPAFRDGLRA